MVERKRIGNYGIVGRVGRNQLEVRAKAKWVGGKDVALFKTL
jgi:hypothetical protein